jgi:hypothetical protein
MSSPPPNSPVVDHELDRLKLEHQIDMDNNVAANVWKTSCLAVDRRCLIFMNQVMFSLAIMIFSMFKLSDNELDTEQHMVYLSLLTTIIGIFLPSPSLRRGD